MTEITYCSGCGAVIDQLARIAPPEGNSHLAGRYTREYLAIDSTSAWAESLWRQ